MNGLMLENKLSPKAPKVWFLSEMLGNVTGFIILAVLFWLDARFSWPDWADWILIGLVVVAMIGTAWSLFEPKWLYKSWSYQVDQEYLQLSSGIWKKEWITVPTAKIQSVSTRQGPLLRSCQLRTVKVETMGSSHTIPMLDEQTALQLREKLAEYAKLREADE